MTAKRVLIVLGCLTLLVVAGWTVALAGVYALGGVMTIEIADRSEGFDLSVPVPMALLHLAADRLASPAVYTAGLGEVHFDGLEVDLDRLAPTVRELAAELDQLPDAVFVEIVEDETYVRVAKRSGRFIVEIEEPDTSVELTIPTRGARRLAERILR